MIRKVEQYLEGIRDGRVVYCLGEKVKDVTTHPILRRVAMIGAMDWILTNDPKHRDLFVTKNEEGEEVHFLWTQAKSKEDLLRRREVYLEGIRHAGIGLHAMGVDGLAALRVLAERMDKKLGTNYVERVESYRRYIQKTDIGVTGAQTDVKGNRSLHPSAQEQHKDFYLRVVDKRDDGIIVRGAKYHISMTAVADEAIVIPCRTHLEADKDYAVCFATPLNAKGITIICTEPEMRGGVSEENTWDFPLSSQIGVGDTEAMIVFDDVFVPWERVFMCGEWQFSRDIAYLFGTFHRLFACCRVLPMLETLTGVSALMAEYNGLENYSHIQTKMSMLIQVTEACRVLGKSACLYPQEEPGTDFVVPNLMYTNIAKYMYASNWHELSKIAQDICGGIAADPITFRDWNNPEERPFLEKYLGGKNGIQTEDRLRAIRLLHDITSGRMVTEQIQAEGSLAAQERMLFFTADWNRYKAIAKKTAGISGWKKHREIRKLRDYSDLLNSLMPPEDDSYNI